MDYDRIAKWFFLIVLAVTVLIGFVTAFLYGVRLGIEVFIWLLILGGVCDAFLIWKARR